MSSSVFPRLFAAASLKHRDVVRAPIPRHGFSAALCRGLIEALASGAFSIACAWFFRGSLPRPH